MAFEIEVIPYKNKIPSDWNNCFVPYINVLNDKLESMYHVYFAYDKKAAVKFPDYYYPLMLYNKKTMNTTLPIKAKPIWFLTCFKDAGFYLYELFKIISLYDPTFDKKIIDSDKFLTDFGHKKFSSEIVFKIIFHAQDPIYNFLDLKNTYISYINKHDPVDFYSELKIYLNNFCSIKAPKEYQNGIGKVDGIGGIWAIKQKKDIFYYTWKEYKLPMEECLDGVSFQSDQKSLKESFIQDCKGKSYNVIDIIRNEFKKIKY